jgi:hypothetical protein
MINLRQLGTGGRSYDRRREVLDHVSRYELYLLVHIGAAAVWIGTGFAMALLQTRAQLARSAARVLALAREGAVLGPRLYLPANLLVLASALLLVREVNWGYDVLWIQLGLAGYALSFAMGVLFFGPGWRRVGRVAERDGVESPAVSAAIRRMLVGSWVDLGLLFGVLFVMTVKPASGEVGALFVLAAIPVCFTVVPAVLLRMRARPTAQAVASTR